MKMLLSALEEIADQKKEDSLLLSPSSTKGINLILGVECLDFVIVPAVE
ncbi:MAG TPA: hypothetical protein PKM72_08625 [Nitrospirales bacterium]|nr:hypothetical protein [Nitrospirales bacterium]